VSIENIGTSLRASEARDVLLVDGDEQGTALTFTELRTQQIGQAGYTAVSLQRAAIQTQVRQLALKYDDIVTEVGVAIPAVSEPH
jgi:chromosome partitioning protein